MIPKNDGFNPYANQLELNQQNTQQNGQGVISITGGEETALNYPLNPNSNTQANISALLNNIAMQQQNCCCENRAAVADLKYTVATENCADRAAVSDGIRDVIANQQANTQSLINSTNAGIQTIMDKICQLELDAKNDKIADLQQQLTMATLRESQGAQTAQILADNAAQTAALEMYLNPPAIPAYTVPNPNCCPTAYYNGCRR